MGRKKYYSVSFWIKIILLLIVIPSIAALIYVNSRMRESLRQQAASVSGDMLGLYMEQLDGMFEDVDIYLTGMMSDNQNIVNLQLQTDRNDRQLTKFALHQDLVASTVSQPNVGGFFVYSCPLGMEDDFFNSVNTLKDSGSENLDGKRILKKMTSKIVDGTLDTSTWFRWKLGDSYYLLRIVYDRNTWLGCWVGLNDLVHPLEKLNLGAEGFSVLTSGQGQILTDNPTDMVMLDINENYRDIEPFFGAKETAPEDAALEHDYSMKSYQQKYLQVSTASHRADLCLVAMIPDKNVLGNYRQVQSVLLVLSLIILVLLPLGALLVQRYIYHPLHDLEGTMEQVRGGNMDVRARQESHLKEFCVLTQRFNEMLDEIHHLKIHMYEQQLKEKETYLQYLQLQIHPHFFLNCMSLMHGLAELGKYKEIQKLSQSLVKYFRYMFKKATSLISVREEMDHIKNYMDIQKMRFPDGIGCTINVDEALYEALIPPLSIQTFVENSVKYALDLTRCTKISVDIIKLGDKMKVSIRDNGRGYPVDVLTVINSDEDIFEGDDTHRIGIRNVKERLKLIFGENSYIHFYNDHGSVVEYVIPLVWR